jgi:hypothetical protein
VYRETALAAYPSLEADRLVLAYANVLLACRVAETGCLEWRYRGTESDAEPYSWIGVTLYHGLSTSYMSLQSRVIN